MCIPSEQTSQLSQTKEGFIIFITNLPNTIIKPDVNDHLALQCLPSKDHNEKVIEDIVLNSKHITVNTNIPTHLTPKQTQQPTSPDITTASDDLHDCTSWQAIHSLTFYYLANLTILIIHHKTKTTLSYFTKTITKLPIGYHLNMLKISSPQTPHVHEANKHHVKAILDAERLFISTENHK